MFSPQYGMPCHGLHLDFTLENILFQEQNTGRMQSTRRSSEMVPIRRVVTVAPGYQARIPFYFQHAALLPIYWELALLFLPPLLGSSSALGSRRLASHRQADRSGACHS